MKQGKADDDTQEGERLFDRATFIPHQRAQPHDSAFPIVMLVDGKKISYPNKKLAYTKTVPYATSACCRKSTGTSSRLPNA